MIFNFFVKCLFLIHKGTLLGKAKAVIYLAFASSPMVYMFDKVSKWTIDNSDYIIFVLGAIVVDHLLGSCVHAFIKRDFTWKKNIIGLGVKIGLAVAIGFLFEGVNHFASGVSFVKSYLIMVLRLAVFFYPAGSAMVNCAIITNGKFPPIGIFEKLNQFNKNLDMDQFKKEKPNE